MQKLHYYKGGGAKWNEQLRPERMAFIVNFCKEHGLSKQHCQLGLMLARGWITLSRASLSASSQTRQSRASTKLSDRSCSKRPRRDTLAGEVDRRGPDLVVEPSSIGDAVLRGLVDDWLVPMMVENFLNRFGR